MSEAALFDGHALVRFRLNRARATMQAADYAAVGSDLAHGQAAFALALTDSTFVTGWADTILSDAKTQAAEKGVTAPGGIIQIFIALLEQYLPQIIQMLIALFGGLIPIPTP